MAASVSGLCIRLTILELAAGDRTAMAATAAANQLHQQQDH
jgi:hypothetical protein